MFVVYICRERLHEYVMLVCDAHVRHIVLRSNLAHLDLAMRHVLAHLPVATIDVTRSLTGASLL
eukprot:6178689-Pleurochrysis_carterae.AAC.2